MKVLVFLVFFMFATALAAADIMQESTMFKGYFGESLTDDIWHATGRTSISDKINPVLNGPDKIYRCSNGIIEIHEVKTYSSWAGRNAMRTTINGNPSYELSREWVENWIQKTLRDPRASAVDKVAAKEVQKAISSGKCVFRLDEINLSTRQIRFSEVIQQGKNNIALKEITGPMKLKYFERFQSQKAREFKQLRAGNVENLLQKPKMTDLKSHPLTRANLEKIHKDLSKSTPVPGLITPEGRLLVAVRTGGYAGLLEFGIEGGCATYSYVKGDINYPEYEEKLWDAAIKGTAVGSCSAVTVFLGASPGGLIVTAVCVGTYLITDQVVTVWRENQKRKFLTVEDLKAWGFELDSILAIPVDSNLVLPQNTILEMRSEPVLQIPTDSVLAM